MAVPHTEIPLFKVTKFSLCRRFIFDSLPIWAGGTQGASQGPLRGAASLPTKVSGLLNRFLKSSPETCGWNLGKSQWLGETKPHHKQCSHPSSASRTRKRLTVTQILTHQETKQGRQVSLGKSWKDTVHPSPGKEASKRSSPPHLQVPTHDCGKVLPERGWSHQVQTACAGLKTEVGDTWPGAEGAGRSCVRAALVEPCRSNRATLWAEQWFPSLPFYLSQKPES